MDAETYWSADQFIDSLDRRFADNQTVGWIYAVRNPEFKRPLLKIGMSSNPPHVRAEQLASTGVPGHFELVYCAHTANARWAEALVHDALAKYRFQPDKEFFEAPIGEVVAVFDQVAAALPIRRSQARSGRYNERSKALAQPFRPTILACPSCGQRNRVRPLAVAVRPSCAKCGAALALLGGLGVA